MLILLRSTTGCNLRCRYCSVACGDTARQDITEEDCLLLRRHLPSLLKKGEGVRFLWHGGEPTLLAPEAFRAMQGIFAQLEQDGYPVSCAMQTNGFVLSDDWLKIMEDFSIGVGLSLDGPAALHDAMRITPAGNGSHAQIMRNLAVMRERSIPVSLLCTLRTAHLGRESEMLDWLEEVHCSIRFNPLLALGRSGDALPLCDYFQFLQRILAESLERDMRLAIEPLEWMLASVIAGMPPRECSCGGNCGDAIFGYGPGGNVYACNRSDELYGNLREKSLQDLYESPRWRERRQRVVRLRAHCGTCDIWDFCHGGCPVVEGERPDAVHCAARRAFFDWLRNDGLVIYQKALLRRRISLRARMRVLHQARESITVSLSQAAGGEGHDI